MNDCGMVCCGCASTSRASAPRNWREQELGQARISARVLKTCRLRSPQNWDASGFAAKKAWDKTLSSLVK